jgi:putative intracellular protease/amidase
MDCYLFVFNGFADWEPSLLTTGLTQFTDVKVKPFSIDGKPVRSMGNLAIRPEMKLENVVPEKVKMLVLPGGSVWESGGMDELLPLVDQVCRINGFVAAICGATLFLARHGLLNEVKHTSNHIYFLKKLGDYHYKGEDLYVRKPCVTDKNLITANGTAAVDFAKAVFTALNTLEGNKKLKFWLELFPKSALPQVSIPDFAVDFDS